MEIRKLPLEKLNPAKYNPRKDLKPSDPEYEKLKKSMETFGYVEPIVWNKRTGQIVGGHQPSVCHVWACKNKQGQTPKGGIIPHPGAGKAACYFPPFE